MAGSPVPQELFCWQQSGLKLYTMLRKFFGEFSVISC